jgi:hypothetical protein
MNNVRWKLFQSRKERKGIMKTTRPLAMILTAGLVFSFNFSTRSQTEAQLDQAQTELVPAADLQPLSREAIPRLGTFYLLSDGRAGGHALAPLPCQPLSGVFYPVYLEPAIFLVDCRTTPRTDAELAAVMSSLKLNCAAAALATDQVMVFSEGLSGETMTLNGWESGREGPLYDPFIG